MKEYFGIETRKKGTILERITSSDSDNILYVNDCYFVLYIDNYYEFYFNPSYFWKKIKNELISDQTIEFLQQNCAAFYNFSPGNHIQKQEIENWQKSDITFPETPRIGNHYSCLGNRIVTIDRKFILFVGFGGCQFKDISKINGNDLINLLYWSVSTYTPSYIRDIYELDCFKETKNELNSHTLIGAIAGDIIGSTYEFNNVKTIDFDLFPIRSKFTDDTVLTVAIADCILNNKDFAKTVWEYGRKYRGRGYGGNFKEWLKSDYPQPYNSFGNGSAMRVSAVGFAYDNLDEVLQKAKKTAEITHNHIEGVKGAQATSSAIFLAKSGKSKLEIKEYITSKFGYNLDFKLDEIRPTYKFDVSCQGSVPQAILAFLESSDYESAIRLAISIGGDSDTIACITGSIATAYYKVMPKNILDFATSKLPNDFISILNEFDKRFITT